MEGIIFLHFRVENKGVGVQRETAAYWEYIGRVVKV